MYAIRSYYVSQLRDGHGAECFLLAYDQFTADRRFVETFCTRLLDEGLQTTPWYCISRLDTVDDDLLALMRRAGCESMCYGIDSGSPRTLAFIRKRIDPSILLQRVAATTAQGMVPVITSYSIHYTKLYEIRLRMKARVRGEPESMP